jgi:hypothetical protein
MRNMDIDGDDTRCLVWTGDLIDIENFTQGGENLYVRTNRLRGMIPFAWLLMLVVDRF